MPFTAWLDDLGKPAWIALTVVGFLVAWPLGVLMLGILIGSGRMGCWSNRYYSDRWPDRWQRRMDRFQRGMDSMQRGFERMQQKAAQWQNRQPSYAPAGGSSGNRAFDEYRTETLRRLEEEQREFMNFLDRLRHAKDKAEFDQFMAERRNHPTPPAPAEGQPQY